MKDRVLSASEFKARCLACLGEIEQSGAPITIQDLNSNPVFRILPLTYEVALEVASLGVLRDPADRAIVATARVHRLRLVTSDRRIIQSQLIQVIE
jgi:PIN domain nuclease of toxin-antitoxin system